MRGANQVAFLAFQELTRRPVQSPPSVRANVKPGADALALAEQQQRLGIAIDHRLDFGEPAVLQLIECGQQRPV